MKVPSYQKQSSLTNQTGGMRFNVNASPEALSQVSSAQTQLYGQLEKTFTSLYENEVKVEREGELAKAKNIYTTQANENELLVANLPKEGVIKGFNKKDIVANKNAFSTIKDKVVQKRFLSWASSEKNDIINRLNKNVRTRIVDEAKANHMTLADTHIEIMSNNEINSLKYLKSRDYLFSDKPIITIDKKSGKQIIGESWKNFMISRNLMSSTAFGDFEKKTKNKIATNKVDKLLSKYGDDNDSKKVKDVITKLQDPNDGDFKGLNFVTRQSLLETALRLEDTIDRRLISLDNKQLSNDKRNRIIKHNKNTAALLVRIETSKNEPTGSNTTNTTTTTMPTAMELIKALKKDEISESSYQMLSKEITGDNAKKDNPTVVIDFTNELSQAETPIQIDEILQKYQKKIGQKGGLTLGTYNAQLNMGQQYKDKTPFAKKVKLYQSNLKKAIGEDRVNNLMGQNTNPDRDMRAAEAIMLFHQKVNDPLNPVDPQIAFYETVNNWRDAVKADLQTTMISPKVTSRMNLGTDFSAEDVQKWKPEQFSKAIAIIKDLPNRNINAKTKVANGVSGMTALEKALEISKIKLIAMEIQSEQNAKKKSKLSIKENEDVNDGGNMWDNIQDIFSWGGNNSSQDKIKKAREGG